MGDMPNPNGGHHYPRAVMASAPGPRGPMQPAPRRELHLPADVPPGVCRFYLAGNCHYGEGCWLLHSGMPVNSTPAATGQASNSMGMAGTTGPVHYPGSYHPSAQGPGQMRGGGRGRRGGYSGGRVPLSSAEMAVTPCWYFQQGKCRYGDHCKYKHEGVVVAISPAANVGPDGQPPSLPTTSNPGSNPAQASSSADATDSNGHAAATADSVNGSASATSESQDAAAAEVTAGLGEMAIRPQGASNGSASHEDRSDAQ